MPKNFILSVGSIIPNKGYDFVIRSMSFIDEEIRPELVIVGSSNADAWINYLKDLAEENNVSLKVKQSVTYEELRILYNEAKLFVFASWLEPFGLVSLEAMACGTPAVAVKESGVREVVSHNKSGLLVDRDEKKFGEAIEYLLSNTEVLDEMSKYSVGYVNDFWTVEKAGERLLEYMYDVLDS